MRLEYLKQESSNILKQFLCFLTNNFWKKDDMNHKILDKNNPIFYQEFELFGLYLEMYITDHDF